MSSTEYINQVANKTKQFAKEDPIDLAYLGIDGDQLYELMASYIVEKYLQYKDTEEGQTIFLAKITKLIAENFVLNYKWLKKYKGE